MSKYIDADALKKNSKSTMLHTANGRCTSTSRQDDWQCYAHDGWKCPTYYPDPELFPVDDFKESDINGDGKSVY